MVVTLRPASPDPDDDFVLECVFNAHATLVSCNAMDLEAPCAALCIDSGSPGGFLARQPTQG
ncbi:hypothetical protein LBMAG42_35500 [Deltaproteobacteria bacterium]|nr:hypothetical protein LBMAG42_35500 [Deltaproteobacteria bacterium]